MSPDTKMVSEGTLSYTERHENRKACLCKDEEHVREVFVTEASGEKSKHLMLTRRYGDLQKEEKTDTKE